MDRILHDRDLLGRYDVGPSGDGVMLTKSQLRQLVFEAAEELKIWSFRCRDCIAWADYALRYRPQYHTVFVCSKHLPPSGEIADFDVVRPLTE